MTFALVPEVLDANKVVIAGSKELGLIDLQMAKAA